MSGYSDYTDPQLQERRRYNVPVIDATHENFEKYGIIYDPHLKPEVIITPWPVTGKRKLMPGTGISSAVSGDFEYEYTTSSTYTYLRAKNHAVGGDYVTGVCYTPLDADVPFPTYILTREANYHPDGGQIFYPTDGSPFILLLALPGDDVQPEDFIGFKFDGTKNVQIFPGVWHQPVFPLAKKTLFRTSQGAVHACVGVDTIDEWGCWLAIQLSPL